MFTSILSCIIIWSAVLIIALRVVTNSGIRVFFQQQAHI